MLPATLSDEDVRQHDRSGMAALIASWPKQIRQQRAELALRGWPKDLGTPKIFAVGGMGGSAIASDLVCALAADRLPFPALTVRDYRWPASIGRDALVLLSSYSGNTEETLALYAEAGARGARRLALATGGELARLGAADGVPRVSLPPGLPPRAALGYSVVSLSILLEALGDPGEGEAAWAESLALLEEMSHALAPDRPEEENPAKALARALTGRALCLYAAAGFPAVVARRWKGQVNENAKTPAFDQALPEMNHNEIVGWQALAGLHPRFAAVFLTDAEASPRLARRIVATRALLEEEGVATHEVRSRGRSRLARLLSLVVLGDWVSLYLAVLAGVDPTPIAKIDRLKAALSGPGTPGDAPSHGGGIPR